MIAWGILCLAALARRALAGAWDDMGGAPGGRALQASGAAPNSSDVYSRRFMSLAPHDALTYLCPNANFNEDRTLSCQSGTLEIGRSGEDAFYIDLHQDPSNSGLNMAVDIRLESIEGNCDLEVLPSHGRLYGKTSVFASIADHLYIASDEMPLQSQLLVVVQAKYLSEYRLTIHFHSGVRTVHPDDRAVMQSIVSNCCQDGCVGSFVSAVEDWNNHRMCGEGGAFPFWYCDRDGHFVHVNLKTVKLECPVSALSALAGLKQLHALDFGFAPGISGDLETLGQVLANVTTLRHLRLIELSGLQGTLEDLCDTSIADLYVQGSVHAPIISGPFPTCIFQHLRVLYLKNAELQGSINVPPGAPLHELHIHQSVRDLEGGARGEDIDVVGAPNLHSVVLDGIAYTGTLEAGEGLMFLKVIEVPLEEVRTLSTDSLVHVILLGTRVSTPMLDFLSDAPALERLQVIGGDLDSLPDNWNVPRLQMLHIESANLHGELPASLARQESLVHLMVRHNNLVGSLKPFATALTERTRLAHLDVSMNALSGRLPRELLRMAAASSYFWDHGQAVNKVNVSHNQLTGRVPKSLLQSAGPEAILHLDISNNDMVCPKDTVGDGWMVHCNSHERGHLDTLVVETPPPRQTGRSLGAAIGISVGVTAGVVLLGVLATYLRRRVTTVDFGRIGHYYTDVPTQQAGPGTGNIQLDDDDLDRVS